MTKTDRLGIALAFILLGACKNDDVDLGGATSAPPAPPTIVGKWRGYHEGGLPGDSANDIHLDLASDGTTVNGTLRYSAKPAPPRPTDPDAPYPPGVLGPPSYGANFVDGFPFTIVGGAVEASRVRFRVWTPEVWSAWCALQTPFAWPVMGGPPEYHCVPPSACRPGADGRIEFYDESGTVLLTASQFRADGCFDTSCGRPLEFTYKNLLPRACACDDKGCRGASVDGDPRREGTVVFDLQLDHDHLDGAGFHFVRE